MQTLHPKSGANGVLSDLPILIRLFVKVLYHWDGNRVVIWPPVPGGRFRYCSW